MKTRIVLCVALAACLANAAPIAVAQQTDNPQVPPAVNSAATPQTPEGDSKPEAASAKVDAAAQQDEKPEAEPAVDSAAMRQVPDSDPKPDAASPKVDATAQRDEKPEAAPAVDSAAMPQMPDSDPKPDAAGPKVDAAAQRDEKPEAAPTVNLDPAPLISAPDPLTPPETAEPAPMAPGAPVAQAPEPPAPAVAPVPEPDPIVTQILAAVNQNPGGKASDRDDVAGMRAFYSERKGEPVWTNKDGFTPRAKQAVREIRKADDWGLEASAFQLPEQPASGATAEVLASDEIKLSLAVLKYARYARGGRLDPVSLNPDMIDRQPHIYNPKSVLEAIAAADSADAYLRGLHPKHEQFKRLRQALLAMNKSASASPSAIKFASGPNIKPGQENPQIELLHKRLSVAAEGGRETYYDNALLEAVNRYQKEHGLEVTGIVDRKLRASLNEGVGGSADENRQRIIANMERWRWMPDDLGEFYVWDSVPEQLTRVFDHGKMTLMERIVVGKPNTPTPTFSANMQFIIFHPEWGVPDGIKVNEIAPKLRQFTGGGGDDDDGGFLFFGGGHRFGGGGGSEVLNRMGLRLSLNGHPVDPDTVNWSAVDIRRYQFIQGAGERNVLGVVKFRFPNKHDVYMHDTPDRQLFGSASRAFSHGCMRTQNPVHLAEVLLAHDKGLSPEQVHQIVASGQTDEIRLTKQIPVHIAYFTAEADEQGNVRYFQDIYGLDNRVLSALKGQPVRPSRSEAVASAEGGTQRDRGARSRDRSAAPRAAQQRPAGFLDWN